MIVHTEFRDGNIPAGYEQLRVIKEALSILPEGVEKVRLCSDTAGYQHDLLKYCAGGKSERFGVIEFAICCDVTQEGSCSAVRTGLAASSQISGWQEGRDGDGVCRGMFCAERNRS